MAKKELNFDIKPKTEKAPAKPAKVTKSPSGLTDAAASLAAKLPSQEDTLMRAKLRDREQFNMGKLPRFVIELFEQGAEKEGKNRTQFFYHLLRQYHGDDAIPPDDRMDARKY